MFRFLRIRAFERAFAVSNTAILVPTLIGLIIAFCLVAMFLALRSSLPNRRTIGAFCKEHWPLAIHSTMATKDYFIQGPGIIHLVVLYDIMTRFAPNFYRRFVVPWVSTIRSDNPLRQAQRKVEPLWNRAIGSFATYRSLYFGRRHKVVG
jgi:hypothetical protein